MHNNFKKGNAQTNKQSSDSGNFLLISCISIFSRSEQIKLRTPDSLQLIRNLSRCKRASQSISQLRSISLRSLLLIGSCRRYQFIRIAVFARSPIIVSIFAPVLKIDWTGMYPSKLYKDSSPYRELQQAAIYGWYIPKKAAREQNLLVNHHIWRKTGAIAVDGARDLPICVQTAPINHHPVDRLTTLSGRWTVMTGGRS